MKTKAEIRATIAAMPKPVLQAYSVERLLENREIVRELCGAQYAASMAPIAAALTELSQLTRRSVLSVASSEAAFHAGRGDNAAAAMVLAAAVEAIEARAVSGLTVVGSDNEGTVDDE